MHETKRLSVERQAIAPDGSDVRTLLGLRGGGMAHFELPPGQTSTAVTHKTVEEIWFVLSGRGQMWRRTEGQEETVEVEVRSVPYNPAWNRFPTPLIWV